jgi:phosphoglycolate/pyridoxal phosphate phosphatase family enzyme
MPICLHQETMISRNALLLCIMMLSSTRAFCRQIPAAAARTLSALSASSSAAEPSALNLSITEQMRVEADQEMQKLVSHYESQDKSTVPLMWKSREEASRFIDEKIDSVLFDCDGVLYRSPDEAPGASDCIKSLLKKGKQVFFVTNNAGSNRSQLREKLSKILQIDQLTDDMMISSSYSCAQYLKQELLEKKGSGSLFVIGSEGLCDELRATGFDVKGGPCLEDKPSMTRDELAAYDFGEHPVDAVVVGHDIEFTFRKMCIANVLLQMNPDAPLVATNEDSFDLVGADSRQIPGNGCVVRALEHSSKRKAINVGKPSKILVDLISSKHGLDPSRSIFLGDRLDTDIRFAVESGMHSALVLTGVTSAEKMIQLEGGTVEEPLPTFILPYVAFLA